MRRPIVLLLLVAAFMSLALAAVAEVVETTDDNAENVITTTGSGAGNQLGDAILTLVGFAGLTPVLKKTVERLVKWFSFLKGDLITGAAILVGWLLAFLFSIDPSTAIAQAVGREIIDLPQALLYLISGILLALAAGYLADREELKYGSLGGAQNEAVAYETAADAHVFGSGVVPRSAPYDPLTPEQRREVGLPPE